MLVPSKFLDKSLRRPSIKEQLQAQVISFIMRNEARSLPSGSICYVLHFTQVIDSSVPEFGTQSLLPHFSDHRKLIQNAFGIAKVPSRVLVQKIAVYVCGGEEVADNDKAKMNSQLRDYTA
jgi:hypothetical protein